MSELTLNLDAQVGDFQSIPRRLATTEKTATTDFPQITRRGYRTLQVNLGYYCNQSCVHCHVNASPYRKERMTEEVADIVIECLEKLSFEVLDLTGGAPELNENFRRIVTQARQQNIEVIDRCNLTVLFESGQEDTAEFLAREAVTIVASMPCYEEENVRKQRGKTVFEKSISALQLLNRLGYGVKEELTLNLVYNPVGAHLPPPQVELEATYKQELFEKYGIEFSSLFTLTNMPINRFGSVLKAHNEYELYMRLLKESFHSENLETVMCRDTVSVDWQGYLYDCDFNQMLDLRLMMDQRKSHLKDLLNQTHNLNSQISVADHCYGCTAGQGSSCQGALIQE